jgi:hypothetical protein
MFVGEDRAGELKDEQDQQRARQGADHGETAHARIRDAEARSDGGRDLRNRDEERVPRRMRLVLRDIEVADAEGEVDGVEIGKGRRQARRVRHQEQHRDRDERRAHGDQTGRSRRASFRLPSR